MEALLRGLSQPAAGPLTLCCGEGSAPRPERALAGLGSRPRLGAPCPGLLYFFYFVFSRV